jgi:hypothetical protein
MVIPITITVSTMVIVVGNVPIAVHVLEITAALALMEIVVPEKTAITVQEIRLHPR